MAQCPLEPATSSYGVWRQRVREDQGSEHDHGELAHGHGVYHGAAGSAIAGVVQTIKALNFMMMAETHDTLGIPLYAVDANPTDPPYCNKDVWQYIVALLDSGIR